MKAKDLRLLLSLSGGRRFIFIVLIGAIVSTSIVIANAYLIGAIIVGLIYHHPDLSVRILQLLFLWLFKALYSSQFDRWAQLQASAIKQQLRKRITNSSHALINNSPAEISLLLVKGSNSLDTYVGRFIPQMFSASFIPFVVIGFIFSLDKLSAFIALLTLPLIPFFGALIGRYTQDSVAKKWNSLGTLSSYFEDSLKGIYTLAIFGRVRSQSSRIREMGERYRSETMKVLRISFISALVLELCGTISVALIAVSIGLRLVNSSMPFFEGLVVLVLAPEVYFPLRNAASLFHASADGVAALTKLTQIELESDLNRDQGIKLIQFESLRWEEFNSPFGEGVIPAGEVTPGTISLISGDSGIGKTTFLYNLLSIRSDTQVFLNGHNICEYSRKDLFKAITWVPQNPTLISGTIRDQFRLINPDITDVQIEHFLSLAALSLNELSLGLDSQIGNSHEKSAQVSGGQIRRIALARALSVNPAVIVADEPNADLDEATSARIDQALNVAAESGIAILVVSHSGSSVLRVDKKIMAVAK